MEMQTPRLTDEIARGNSTSVDHIHHRQLSEDRLKPELDLLLSTTRYYAFEIRPGKVNVPANSTGTP